MQLSKQWESYALFGIPAKTYGGGVGAILNTVWITVMNIVYFKIAKWLNDKENHRTETEHEDQLIIKTFLFQFFNSYAFGRALNTGADSGRRMAATPLPHTPLLLLLLLPSLLQVRRPLLHRLLQDDLDLLLRLLRLHRRLDQRAVRRHVRGGGRPG